MRRSSFSPSTTFRQSTLATPAHHQPHRIHLRTGESEDGSYERTGLKRSGVGDDLQVVGSGRREVAKDQRTSPCLVGESRGEVRKRGVGGEKRGEGRRVIRDQSTTFDDTSAVNQSNAK